MFLPVRNKAPAFGKHWTQESSIPEYLVVLLEFLACITFLLGLFLLRARISDIPLYVTVSLTTAAMWLSSVRGGVVHIGDLSIYYSSAVFFSALLVILMVAYVQEGPGAGRMMLSMILGSSVLVNGFIAMGISYLPGPMAEQLAATYDVSLVNLLGSIFVLFIDFSILTITYGLLQRSGSGSPLYLRILAVLGLVQVLDGSLFLLIADFGEPDLLMMLIGMAASRLLLTLVSSPFVYVSLQLDRRISGRHEEGQLPLFGLFSLEDIKYSRLGKELKLQADQLRENEMQFRDLIESLHGVTWELDLASLQFTYMGPQIEKMTGFAPELWTGFDFWKERIHPDDRERAAEFCRQQTSMGRDHIFDYRILRADGAVIWIKDNVVVVMKDGKAVKLRGILLDITEQKAAQQKLVQSEQRYRTIVEFAVEALVILDTETFRFAHANHKAEQLFRLNRDKLMQVGPLELSPEFQPDGRPSLEKGREYVIAAMHGSPQEFEWIHLDSTGREITCEVRLVQIPGQDKPLLRGSLLDITERKAAEKELAESRYREQELAFRFRLAADSARLGIWDFDLLANRLIWDQRMHELYQVPPDKFEGSFEAWADCLHPDDLEASKIKVDQALMTDDNAEMSFRIVLPDQSIRYIYSIARILRDATGRPYRMIGLNRDVTEEQLAEAELRRAREMQFKAGEIANVGGWELDLITQSLVWSPQTKRIHEVTDEFEPRLESAINFYAPEHRQLISDAVQHGIETGEPWDLELDLITAKGRRIRVRAVGQTDYVDGKPVRLWGAFQDITERVSAEQERLHLQQQVLHAQKLESLGVLSGGIAHDFNNLLTSILGNAELAVDEVGDNPGARESIEEIQLAAQRAASLSRQMLAYSGKGRFVIEQVNINEFIEEMANLLEVSINKKAVMEYQLSAEIPLVMADPTQIRQVIMNLITNASEALENRSGFIQLRTGTLDITSSAELLEEAGSSLHGVDGVTPGCYAFFEVRDSGCGMDDETVARIFDPFFTTKFTGRGLGLAAVLGIVRGHSGAIHIRTAPGEGTAIRVLLPECRSSRVGQNDSRITANGSWVGSGLVLLADDDELVLTVGKRMLGNFGFEVVTATDGLLALEEFRRRSDDFVLAMLDLTMPNLGGDEALRELRKIRPDLKILLCSGYDEMEVSHEVSNQPGVSFVQKPYLANDLRNAIRQLLESGRQEALVRGTATEE